jgi:predicted nucleotidyltransferase
MTNTLIDLSGKVPDKILEILGLIAVEAEKLRIPVFVVGATARDLILEYVYGIKPKRATTDVDFAVAVETWEQYEFLKKALLDTKEVEFNKTTLNFRKISNGTLIDIVPFGGVESPPGYIAFEPHKDPEMTTAGFIEAYKSSLAVRLSPDLEIKVVSLPGLALLKIIAWYDRPNDRERDIQDLWILLKQYLNAGNRDRLFDEHLDLVDDDFDYELAGARVLGRDVAKLLTDQTRSIVMSVLSEEAPGKGIRRMASVINRHDLSLDDITEHALGMLRSFREGISEGQTFAGKLRESAS